MQPDAAGRPATAGNGPDVLIAGGGMVGASLAVALDGLGLAVELVEAVPPGAAGQPSFDRRSVALSRSTQCILATLGLWPAVGAAAVPILRIHVSEQGRFGSAVIDAAREGVPALGYVIDGQSLGAVLWERLRRSGVTVRAPASVTAVAARDGGLEAEVTANGAVTRIAPQLLVVADGARSRLRAALGIDARVRPYSQVAITGRVTLARGRVATTAFERFAPDGPLALLPAAPDAFAFVVTRRADAADAVLALDDAGFVALLQREFGTRAGRFGSVSPRSAYPLDLVTASALTAPRAVLIGNAAHGLHPVAGQGYNLGLRDVAALAEVIADARRSRGAAMDPGSDAVLAAYREWRLPDQRNVVRFTDGLVRLFGADLPGAGWLRALGLLAFDALPGTKPLLARSAMGLGGRMARLTRGLSL